MEQKISLEQAAKLVIEYEKGWQIPKERLDEAERMLLHYHTKARKEFNFSQEKMEKAIPFGVTVNFFGVIENLFGAGYLKPKTFDMREIKEMERIRNKFAEFAKTSHQTTDRKFKDFCNGLIEKPLFEAMASTQKFKSDLMNVPRIRNQFLRLEKELGPASRLPGRQKATIEKYLKHSIRN
ncbi:MAG: hypothetical protein AB1467_04450 [Candidatus Diapherotrites archaeon]